MVQDLDFVRDKMPSFFAVTGDGGAGYGKLYSQIQFDGGVDYNGPRNLDSVLSYTWEQKRGGPSG